jgi:hypothetical protein
MKCITWINPSSILSIVYEVRFITRNDIYITFFCKPNTYIFHKSSFTCPFLLQKKHAIVLLGLVYLGLLNETFFFFLHCKLLAFLSFLSCLILTLWVIKLALTWFSCFNLLFSYTHIVKNSLMNHFPLYML